MDEIFLDMFQSAALGAAVLVIGVFLVNHVAFFRKYCIPSAVVGGLIFSVIMLLLYEGAGIEIIFEDTFKNICMNLFFCSIGFMASVSMIKAGGKMVLIVGGLIGALIIIQNIVGMASVTLFGLEPGYGLALGSISLAGGHGTAAAYGEILVKDYGLVGADVVAVASATVGLAIAGLLGGPLARHLISKNSLKSDEVEPEEVKEKADIMNKDSLLMAMILLAVCIGLGMLLDQAFTDIGVVFPSYFGGLILAIIARNIADMKGYKLPVKEIETIGWLGLCLFLSMALMGIKLWQIAGLAGAMIATLVIQTVIIVLFAYYVVFRFAGRDYEASAITAGFVGFGIGATPNAVANVEAIKKEHGPAQIATFVIPLVGGVVLDVINVTVLTITLNFL